MTILDILPSEYGGVASLVQMTRAWAEVVAEHRDILLGRKKVFKSLYFT